MEIHEILLFPIREETALRHPIRDEFDIGHQVRFPIYDEMPSFVPIQLLGDPLAARRRCEDSHHHRIVFAPFESGECIIMKQIIKLLKLDQIYLNIFKN